MVWPYFKATIYSVYSGTLMQCLSIANTSILVNGFPFDLLMIKQNVIRILEAYTFVSQSYSNL